MDRTALIFRLPIKSFRRGQLLLCMGIWRIQEPMFSYSGWIHLLTSRSIYTECIPCISFEDEVACNYYNIVTLENWKGLIL